MTKTLREAAQMALDALTTPPCMCFAGCAACESAPSNEEIAEALRAALALPDEPSMTVAFDEGVKEPRIVSWNEHPTGMHLMYSAVQPAPLERQPLTPDEIFWWWGSENGLEDCRMTKLTEFTDVIRAVEAKHNIKGAA